MIAFGFGFIILGLLAWQFIAVQHVRQRELGRFSAQDVALDDIFERRLDRWLAELARFFGGKKAAQRLQTDADMRSKLHAAGLESASGQGKFVLIKLVCYGSWPVISVFALSNFSTYYATVTIVFSFAIIILLPHLWLKRKTLGRKEKIQRELPLFIDLVNLATSAGWDVSAGLERVIDALAPEFPDHPLIKELKRARWLCSSGYTWGEALDRVSNRLGEDGVTRATKALVQAMEQGGDRSGQLSGIAADAQRTYYAVLDKRLAAVPVKALVITLVLFLMYFTILFAPAVLGIADTLRAF